ncbi:MAG: hypothetical protein FWG88_09300, partial [Oscillospiraceae bacterium]|nr:hypothetical protein [Oscillospiraceae bacterium]
TGGAGDKKLYTTRPGFYGSGDLTISIPADLPQKQLIKSLIDICVDDLKEGFLNIGGEGSVGGGRMKITDGGSWI